MLAEQQTTTHAEDTAFIAGYEAGQEWAHCGATWVHLDLLRADQKHLRHVPRGFLKGMVTGALHVLEAFEAQEVEAGGTVLVRAEAI